MFYLGFTLLAIYAVSVIADANQCPAGWYTNNNHCYFFSRDTRSWESAQNYCQSVGSYLARIESKQENDYLKAIAKSRNSGNIWFDLTDFVKEGHWIYLTNGKDAKFTDWKKGEPNLGKLENCACLYKSYGYKWVDYTCNSAIYYICEKKLISAAETECARIKALVDSLAACRKDCKC